MTELINIEQMKALAPAVMAAEMKGAFKGIFAKVEAEIAAHKPDLSTDTSRKAIASLAYSIARTKTALDGAATELVEDQQKTIDGVKAERKLMREELDRLRDLARKPLNEWEAEQASRKEVSEAQINLMRIIESSCADNSSDGIEAEIAKMNALELDEVAFGDGIDAAREFKSDATARMVAKLETAKNAERDRAELEELRIAKAESEAREDARLESERLEAARKLAEEQAENNRKKEEADALARAEQAKLNAEAKAKADAQAEIDAANKRAAEAEAEAKRKIDIERKQAERAAIEQEAADNRKRADAANRSRVESRCVEELISATGMPQKWALAAIQATAHGKVSAMQIDYLKCDLEKEDA